jgi:Zn-dependent protease with chaperone function
MPQSDPTLASPPSDLPVNDLAAAYQPRRVWAAGISITWNLLFAFAFIASQFAWGLYNHLLHIAQRHGQPEGSAQAFIIPCYLALYFLAYSAVNYPLELYFGYLEERQFGLAKDGIRAWTHDWVAGVLQHGFLFFIGSALLLLLQRLLPQSWLAWAAALVLALFLGTTYLAADLLPLGLFQFERADASTTARLAALAGEVRLPPIVIFSAPALRDFNGGLLGLANRQVLLISRATLVAASDAVLRFVLRHEAGHRRYHHLLLSTLAGWAWVVTGLVISQRIIPHIALGLPPYIAWLALTLSAWMALGEPLLAYLGRRLEYQADRYYLRHGGTSDEMRAALGELSRRNLARTEGLRRRQRVLHPLPSVTSRLFAARRYERSLIQKRSA